MKGESLERGEKSERSEEGAEAERNGMCPKIKEADEYILGKERQPRMQNEKMENKTFELAREGAPNTQLPTPSLGK